LRDFPVILVIIVRAAAELQVPGRRRSAFSERDHMMELEEPSFLATPLSTDKRAPPLIAFPYFSLCCRGHMATCGIDRARTPWAINCRKLLPLHFLQQQRQTTVEDFSNVAAGQGMSQEILDPA